MRILHICPDFHNTNIYKNLIMKLSENGVENRVIIPTRKSKVRVCDSEEVYTLPTFSNVDRLMFYRKQDNILKMVEEKKYYENMDIVHAHTLFSSGYLAYKIHKEYNIPYIVAVRNTDVNIFFKYMIHLRKLGMEILKNAKKIVFISPSYKEAVFKRYISKELLESMEEKTEIIPNGINDEWFQGTAQCRKIKETISFVQVGKLDKNKNHNKSLNLIKELNRLGYRVRFNIVGDGKKVKMIKSWEKKYNFVKYHGNLDIKQMKDLYIDQSFLILPSKKETFGLVYIEAMSQGIPIICTEGQGVSGYFKEYEVGAYLNKNKKDNIDKILNLINNYERLCCTALKKSK
ncbi:MAG: glycosyltransferase family 4 protein, partial [Clostridium sp.]